MTIDCRSCVQKLRLQAGLQAGQYLESIWIWASGRGDRPPPLWESPVKVKCNARFGPLIARREMRTPPRTHTPSADTPMSRSSVSDPLPRDRRQLHIGDMFERKPAKHRSRPGTDPCNRRSRGKSACNRAAHMHGTFGLLPSPPPASHAASGRDANRIAERIVVWMSCAGFLFITR